VRPSSLVTVQPSAIQSSAVVPQMEHDGSTRSVSLKRRR
jgi:hypothetical protein